MKMILSSKSNDILARITIFLTMIALIAGMVGCGEAVPEPTEISSWYDLDAVRDNMGGSYLLMNDLDSTTAGYKELASPTANGGKGWRPIGTKGHPIIGNGFDPFTGTFDGQGYKISDLFINCPKEYYEDALNLGLFGYVREGGVIKDTGVMNVTVIGGICVGSLVGYNYKGTVSNCYSSGNLTGKYTIGGLAGANSGTVSNSYSCGNVNGTYDVGGLVGGTWGTVSDSYATGNVTGDGSVGGLVGSNDGTISNSYATGSVIGNRYTGGIAGWNDGILSNSYSIGSVTKGDDYYCCISGLVGKGWEGIAPNSFWDTDTSGQSASYSGTGKGTGKTTAEMQDITTFSSTTWDIVAVANPSIRNPSYIWNIVDDETYPFLSWQPVS
jgi:hypothetical protein